MITVEFWATSPPTFPATVVRTQGGIKLYRAAIEDRDALAAQEEIKRIQVTPPDPVSPAPTPDPPALTEAEVDAFLSQYTVPQVLRYIVRALVRRGILEKP